MGVPTFYRWLSCRYPKVVVDVGPNHADDLRRERANELRAFASTNEGFAAEQAEDVGYDCLYLDMNGIIHPCCHSEDGGSPPTEDDMFKAIFAYIDRLVRVVQPRLLLYMAIDGVAPRAKMNQQRIRRFKAAKDIEEEAEAYEAIRKEFEQEGRQIPAPKEKWDSNVITPGTPFMDRLATALRYYIQDRLAKDPLWIKLQVYLSDANVPGEGEHKIVEFIREQRKQTEYNPNLYHVLHGADADLIMLGLATHEANFYILREAVVERTATYSQEQDGCGNPSRKANAEDCLDQLLKHEEAQKAMWKPLQMIQLPVLREYLEHELCDEGRYDLERVVDDFVFLCFLCGNDFLPHLPHQSIQKGSIDALIQVYKLLRPNVLTSYITSSGRVNLLQLEIFLKAFSKVEDEMIRAELGKKEVMREKLLQEKKRPQCSGTGIPLQSGDIIVDSQIKTRRTLRNDVSGSRLTAVESDRSLSNECAALELKRKLRQVTGAECTDAPTREAGPHDVASGPAPKGAAGEGASCDGIPRNSSFNLESERGGRESERCSSVVSSKASTLKQWEEDVDLFREKMRARLSASREIDNRTLLTQGVDSGVGCRNREAWWGRYYKEKFHLEIEEEVAPFAMRVADEYILGLQWVLLYYYQGCRSYDWFFPFHYAPLALDLSNAVSRINAKNRRDQDQQGQGRNGGTPLDEKDLFEASVGRQYFTEIPRTDLMAVLPPFSSKCLPSEHAALMCSPVSCIADFYPKSAKYDPNGKRYQWQWVVLLPFIDKARLLKVTRPLESSLSTEERFRNRLSETELFVHQSHPLSLVIGKLTAEDGRGLEPHEEPAWDEMKPGQLPRGVVGKGVSMQPAAAGGLNGQLFFDQNAVALGGHIHSPVDGLAGFDSCARGCFFSLPRETLSTPHQSKLPAGVKPRKPTLDEYDIVADPSKCRAFCGSAARRVVFSVLGNPRQPHQQQPGRGEYRGLPTSYNSAPRNSQYPQLWQPPHQMDRNFGVQPAAIIGTVMAAPQQAISAAVRVQQQLMPHVSTRVDRYYPGSQGSLQHAHVFGANYPVGQMQHRNVPHQGFLQYSSAPSRQHLSSTPPWETPVHSSNQHRQWEHDGAARNQTSSESTYVDLTFKGRGR